MSFTENQKKIAALYIAAYNRAPDLDGLNFWTEHLDNAADAELAYNDIAEQFVSVALFEEIYNTAEGNRTFVESVYENMFGEPGDETGIAFWTEKLDDGLSKGDFLVQFVNSALGTEENEGEEHNEQGLAHRAILENKIAVSEYYIETLGEATNVTTPGDVNDPAYQNSINILAGVTADEGTVASAKETIDGQVVEPVGDTYYLAETRDVLEGTENADTFIADIVQNQNGQQVNTLGSGDRIDGGAGTDTLKADITAGAYVGSGNMAIRPITTSVENIKLNAVESNLGAGEAGNQVFLNAQNMTEVNYIGSEYSNANLTIQDLTSKGVAGGTANMTVGMKYTGNKDSAWDESDLNVFFDQDYLTRSSDTQNGWSYQILNQASWDLNNSEPVKGFPLERITFTLARENLANKKVTLSFTAEDRAGLVTQQDLVNALNAKLAEEGLTGLEFSLNGTFTDGDGRTSQSINLVNTNDAQEVVAGTVGLDEDSPAGNLYWNNARLEDVVTDNPVSVNVELEKVGRAGDGGELVIGSMNKDGTNTWDAVNTVGENTVSGVEVFNVTVDGGKAESSSLAGMRSTNNNLREVNVVSANGSDANLWIGNSNSNIALVETFDTMTMLDDSDDGLEVTYSDLTSSNKLAHNASALKDVQTFDASGFNGDLHLTAALTAEVTEKYLKDGDASFIYTGGAGSDTFDVALSAENLAAAGNATSGNFSFKIDGRAGNDTITVGIYDEVGLADADSAAWYANQKTNANLRIDAGEGNDTVNLQGSGDWVVDLGAGNDVIYVDNAGGSVTDESNPGNVRKASWIFNATDVGGYAEVIENDNLIGWTDVVGGGNNTYNLYHAGITLTLKDDNGGEFELKLSVEPDVGSGATKYQTSQKAINEAIKAAIADDPLFSKLVEAKTGQSADTLIINSLIDGDGVDLGITFTQPVAPLTAAAVTAHNAEFGANITAAGLAGATGSNLPSTTANTDFNANNDMVNGSDGNTFGAQTITGGEGDDVFVLGTSANQSHTLVYEGYGNGSDTILNFTTASDTLDLTSYGALDTITSVFANDAATQTGVNAQLADGKYIVFNANPANAGEFEVEVWEKAANPTDTAKLGTIGTIDFGDNGIFVAINDAVLV